MTQKSSQDRFLITLSDVLTLFRKSKWKIISCILLMTTAAMLWALTKPIKYKAEGSYRVKNVHSSPVGFAQLLFNEGMNLNVESEALSIFKSRQFIEEVIRRLNLQGRITFPDEGSSTFSLIKNNLKIEWVNFRNFPYPLFKDIKRPLELTYIYYPGEVPVHLSIRLKDGDHFLVEQEHEIIGEGQLGVPFVQDSFAFTLEKRTSEEALPETFGIVLKPLADLAMTYAKQIEIDFLKIDKNVLTFTYLDENRHTASRFINMAMEVYQDYIKEEHNEIARTQMSYLHTRQEESAEKLKELMSEHAEHITSDLSMSGFIDSKMEMDFLIRSQHELKEKLLANELEIKRLFNLQANHYVHYDQYTHRDGSPNIINSILVEIRGLKQERDGLELAIKENSQLNYENLTRYFDQQLVELQQIKQQKLDLRNIVLYHTSGETLNESSALLQDPRYLMKEWISRLHKTEDKEVNGEEWQKNSDQFVAYLDNVERLLNVHEKILQARLAHQQKASGEYQGINLKTAHELYLEYCKKLSSEESTIRQTNFFLDRMKEDPDFEITSLCSVLVDPVSAKMISKASDLIMQIKDESNQSLREQTRLQDDLTLQRTFLSQHVKQMIQLMELNRKLIGEKIFSLQNVSLELIHQQIYLLEKNLEDYTQSRLGNLEQERMIVQKHLKEIQNEMLALPKKWMAERLIEERVESNQSIVKEIANIVESKTISHNLDVIQSAPIDKAYVPLNPKSPRTMLYGILGAFLGGFLGVSFVLGQSLAHGLRVSLENLRSLGLYVCGYFSSSYNPNGKSSLSDSDLNTLRRIYSYLEVKADKTPADVKSVAKTVLLIEGRGPDYSFDLAYLFHKAGQKVLIIDLDFDRSMGNVSSGLLQYLDGDITTLPIVEASYGAYLPSGGSNRFALELLTSRVFVDALNELVRQYDWIIAVSHAMPLGADAEGLSSLFSSSIITLQDEKVDDLQFYINSNNNPNKNVAVVLTVKDAIV